MSIPEGMLKIHQKILYDRSSSPLERACSYHPKRDDILICGPRRSGTTWLQQIMHEIRMKGENDFYGRISDLDIDQLVWYIPPYSERMDFDLNGAQMPADRARLYKTHECFEDAPKYAQLRYVVLVRNPLDIVWSEKRSKYQRLGFEEDVGDSESVLRPFGTRPDGSETDTCWDHMLSWWPHRKDTNILWIHYEDLISNLKYCIQALAAFMAIQLDDEELERIHDRCTFRYMKENVHRYSGRFLAKIKSDTLGVKCWNPLIGGLRLDGGTVGQGAQKLNENLKAKVHWFWRHYAEPLTGYQNYAAMYSDTSLLMSRGKMRSG